MIRKDHPELRLKLVGRGDTFIRHLIPADANIDTTGSLDDTFPEIAKARIVVAPLRAGSGTRIKILEAWAAERAIVATPLAAEGLAVEDGVNIILSEDTAEFAASVSKLLRDVNGRQRMGAAGRQTFESGYTWERAWRDLDHDLQVKLSEEVNRYTE